ncbi:MAG: hypothetical protein JXR83_10000 [Deltaproteobacteria bacterium]|nr:hypothetical protein [Deltaproteobacteria bacterium]
MTTQIELPLLWDEERLVVELPGRPARLDIRLTGRGAELAFVPHAAAAPAAADPVALRLRLTAPVAIDASPRLRWLLLRFDPRRGSWLEFALRLVRRIARVAMGPGADDAHAALDRALERTAAHLRSRLDRRCWQLARSFCRLDSLAVYAALVDDGSGRLALLAECAPGLLTLALAAPPEIGGPLRAAALAGEPLAALLDIATGLWAQHRLPAGPDRDRHRRQRLCALQRLRLASAGPAVGWELLRTTPVSDFSAADIPLDVADNATWFALHEALRASADAFAECSQAPLCRRFARYVSHHCDFFAAAAPSERWPALLRRLWDRVRTGKFLLQLREPPATLLADGARCRPTARAALPLRSSPPDDETRPRAAA